MKMPLFMDVHHLNGSVSIGDVVEAHRKDLETQGKYGVEYKRDWVDEAEGKIFCLVEAPDVDAAHTVHREAHGSVADEIFEVSEGLPARSDGALPGGRAPARRSKPRAAAS
jgi:hypothetical protein